MQSYTGQAQQQATATRGAGRLPKKSAKLASGPDKQVMVRKRKADAALDVLAAHPSQGATPFHWLSATAVPNASGVVLTGLWTHQQLVVHGAKV